MRKKKDEVEKLVVEKFKDEIEKARLQGISIGAKTIAAVVSEMICDVNDGTSKNELLRRVGKIRDFCDKAINKEQSIKI